MILVILKYMFSLLYIDYGICCKIESINLREVIPCSLVRAKLEGWLYGDRGVQ